jgi:hypothetical protein
VSARTTIRHASGSSLACLAAGALTSAAGCAGGAPLLHPAQTLGTGDVRAAAGLSAHAIPGALGSDLSRARELAARDPSSPGAPGTNPDYAKGALVAASVGPGLAPYVAARVGVGHRFEGGLTYTGRAVRGDMRRSFEDGPWALSLGVGASAALYGRQEDAQLPNVDLNQLHGYGVDLPVLAGWQSAGGLYTIWFGPRGGFEWVTVETLTSEPKSITIGTPPIHLDATRGYVGGVVGVQTGFRHLHVALEGQVDYQIISGTYNGTTVNVSGLTITPATALWFTF